MERGGRSKRVPVETTAQGYLEVLRDRGIEVFFGNGGTDFAPIIDAFARFAADGKATPRPLTVPHEFVAVSMAHGYAALTGKPQVVMVHVIVGTANALGALINAARAQVPVLLTAGRTPWTEAGHLASRSVHIHWAQESFDQAGMLREFVKWDYELRSFAQLPLAVDRALAVALTEPRGPVYLSLPREVLAEAQTALDLGPPRLSSGTPSHPDPEAIARAAAFLAEAETPLIITSALGRHPEAVPALVDLAEAWAIPVVEANPLYMNFPAEHPLHQGFSAARRVAPIVAEADALLVVESDVPWIPKTLQPPAEAAVIQMGVDPLLQRYPMRGFAADLAIVADPRAGLRALGQALEARRPGSEGRIRARAARLESRHRQAQEARERQVRGAADLRPISFDWLSHCIGEVVDGDTIVVNEYDLRLEHVRRRPGHYFASPPASCLGWALGASLGAKLAAPEKTVIVTVGDGAYHFGIPTATHWVSAAYGLPILFVIFNNQEWGAVRAETLDLYPEGWAAGSGHFALSSLAPSPAYETVVTAFGGYGERVEDPREVGTALKRALKVVRDEKRQALLNVICRPA